MASILAFFWSAGEGADVWRFAPRGRKILALLADPWNSGGRARLLAVRRCTGPGGSAEVTGPGGWTGAGGTDLMTGAWAAKYRALGRGYGCGTLERPLR